MINRNWRYNDSPRKNKICRHTFPSVEYRTFRVLYLTWMSPAVPDCLLITTVVRSMYIGAELPCLKSKKRKIFEGQGCWNCSCHTINQMCTEPWQSRAKIPARIPDCHFFFQLNKRHISGRFGSWILSGQSGRNYRCKNEPSHFSLCSILCSTGP